MKLIAPSGTVIQADGKELIAKLKARGFRPVEQPKRGRPKKTEKLKARGFRPVEQPKRGRPKKTEK